MTEKGFKLLHRIIGILIAISIVIAGICLAIGCCYIYFSDDMSYSRIAVSDVFAVICIPVYACLVLVVTGCLSELLLPSVKQKSKASHSSETAVNNLLKKRGLSSLSEHSLSVHYREKGKRTLNSIIMTALTLAACTVFFIYALDRDNFDNVDINGSVISALLVLTPCVLLPFSFHLYSLISKERGFKRVLAALKIDAEAEVACIDHKPRFESFDIFVSKVGRFFENSVSGRPLMFVRITIVAIAMLCLVFGLAFGGTADVFTKASNICTECIGLG